LNKLDPFVTAAIRRQTPQLLGLATVAK
jgi:hypothetical protein